MNAKEVFSIFAFAFLVIFLLVVLLQQPVPVVSLDATGRAVSEVSVDAGSVSTVTSSGAGSTSTGTASGSTSTSSGSTGAGSAGTGANTGGTSGAGGSTISPGGTDSGSSGTSSTADSSGKQVSSAGNDGSSGVSPSSTQGSSSGSVGVSGGSEGSGDSLGPSPGSDFDTGSGIFSFSEPSSPDSQFSLRSSLGGTSPQVQSSVLETISKYGFYDPEVSSVDSDGKTTVVATRSGKLLGIVPVNYDEVIVFGSDGDVIGQRTSLWAAIFIR